MNIFKMTVHFKIKAHVFLLLSELHHCYLYWEIYFGNEVTILSYRQKMIRSQCSQMSDRLLWSTKMWEGVEVKLSPDRAGGRGAEESSDCRRWGLSQCVFLSGAVNPGSGGGCRQFICLAGKLQHNVREGEAALRRRRRTQTTSYWAGPKHPHTPEMQPVTQHSGFRWPKSCI